MQIDIQQLSDNAEDIGLVSGVLQGIELTPTLLPNQKEAIVNARKAIDRIGECNRTVLLAALMQEKNEPPKGNESMITFLIIFNIALLILDLMQIKVNRATGEVFRVLVDASEIKRKRLDNQQALIQVQQKMLEELRKEKV